MKQLVNAVLEVMEDCKGIEKSMTVGKGTRSAYKGVSDKDVKLKVGESMRKHGLIILPTDIMPRFQVNEWEQTYNGNVQRKQSVFTEVITKYTLAHKSGESIQLAGYGHGVDSQDKGAGKATTYALKYTLLYSFLVATGHIDDTDNTHSEEIAPKTVETKKIEDSKAVTEKPADKAALNKMFKYMKTKGLKTRPQADSVLAQGGFMSLSDSQWDKIKDNL
jgi:hypothetical protein